MKKQKKWFQGKFFQLMKGRHHPKKMNKIKNQLNKTQKILEETVIQKHKAQRLILKGKIAHLLKNQKYLQKRQFAKNDFKMRINIHCNSKDRWTRLKA